MTQIFLKCFHPGRIGFKIRAGKRPDQVSYALSLYSTILKLL